MRNTYIIFSLLIALFVGFGLFAPSEASAYGSYYNYYGYYHYDIPSYSTDYPGYHGYRNSSYPMDNSYITPKVNNSYQAAYPKTTYNYTYNNNYNFYNAPVYKANDVVYPYSNSNYNTNYNNNYQNNDNGYYNNNESCYGYGC